MKLWMKYINNTQQRRIEWKRITSYLKAHPKAIAKAAVGSLIAGGLLNGMLVCSLRSATGNAVYTWNPIRLFGYGTVYTGSFPGWMFVSLVILMAVLAIGKKFILEQQLVNEEGEFVHSLTGEYGTARQLEDADKKQLFKTSKNVDDLPNDILGMDKDTDEPFCLNPDADYNYQVCPHKIVAASSGRGKTRSIILNDILQAIRRRESIICTDPKGEVYKMTSHYAEESGYEVRVLNLVDMVNSDGINFLSLVNYDAQKAMSIADTIVRQSVEAESSDIFLNGAKALIACAILVVTMEPEYEGRRNLYEVFKFLNGQDIPTIAAKIQKTSPTNPARDQWDFFMTGSQNLQGSIMANAGSMLSIYSIPKVRAIISHDETDLLAPSRKPCAYYVIMQSSDRTYDAITAQYFSMLLRELETEADSHANQKVRVPVNIILEEFANCGRIPNITGAFTTFRSRGVKLTIVIQGIEQIERLYPNLMWRDFTSNTDIKIVLGVNDTENATYWSEQTGEATTEVTNINEDAAEASIDIRVGKGKRYLMTANEVSVLSRSRELVFIGGFNVLIAKKFDYTKHPDSKKLKMRLGCEHKPKWWNDPAVQNEVWFQFEQKNWKHHMAMLKDEMKELEKAEAEEWERMKEEEAQAERELQEALQNDPMLRAKYKASQIASKVKETVWTKDGKFNTPGIKAGVGYVKQSAMSSIHDIAKKVADSTAAEPIKEQHVEGCSKETVHSPVEKRAIPEASPITEVLRQPKEEPQTPADINKGIAQVVAEALEEEQKKTEEAIATKQPTETIPQVVAKEDTSAAGDESDPEEDDTEVVEYIPSEFHEEDDDDFFNEGDTPVVELDRKELARRHMAEIQAEQDRKLRELWTKGSTK